MMTRKEVGVKGKITKKKHKKEKKSHSRRTPQK